VVNCNKIGLWTAIVAVGIPLLLDLILFAGSTIIEGSGESWSALSFFIAAIMISLTVPLGIITLILGLKAFRQERRSDALIAGLLVVISIIIYWLAGTLFHPYFGKSGSLLLLNIISYAAYLTALIALVFSIIKLIKISKN